MVIRNDIYIYIYKLLNSNEKLAFTSIVMIRSVPGRDYFDCPPWQDLDTLSTGSPWLSLSLSGQSQFCRWYYLFMLGPFCFETFRRWSLSKLFIDILFVSSPPQPPCHSHPSTHHQPGLGRAPVCGRQLWVGGPWLTVEHSRGEVTPLIPWVKARRPPTSVLTSFPLSFTTTGAFHAPTVHPIIAYPSSQRSLLVPVRLKGILLCQR